MVSINRLSSLSSIVTSNPPKSNAADSSKNKDLFTSGDCLRIEGILEEEEEEAEIDDEEEQVEIIKEVGGVIVCD